MNPLQPGIQRCQLFDRYTRRHNTPQDESVGGLLAIKLPQPLQVIRGSNFLLLQTLYLAFDRHGKLLNKQRISPRDFSIAIFRCALSALC